MTGHRDLRPEDIPLLENRLREIFADLEQRYPASPLVLLSSLAEGADRLSARVALECGISLICPLPMSRALYEEDFLTPESKKEFADLLDRSDDWFELPLLSTATIEEVKNPGEKRNHQYAYVGAYLCRHSQIIIALWDGSPIELVGGTTYIVGFKLRGIPPPYIIQQGRFEPEEIGPVYHVLSPRMSHDLPSGEPGSLKIIYPKQYKNEDAAKRTYDRILENTNRFNKDEIDLREELSLARDRSEEYLFADAKKYNNEYAQLLVSRFAISDSLAVYFQKHTLRLLTILFSFALLATIVFELYAYLMMDSPSLLLLFFGTLAGAYGIYSYSAKKGYQDKFQDYRTLAEGLRVQFYWQFVDLKYSAANYYLGDQHGELDWIRHALRMWALPFSEESKSKAMFDTASETERWKALLNDWVVSQNNYFTRSSVRENLKVQKANMWARVCLMFGFSLIAFNLIYQYFIGHTALPVFLYISSVTPIAAGLLYGYTEKRALADHVKQYERMANLFSRAQVHLEQLISDEQYDEARKLIFDLGKEALKENGRWVITHRERPIEFPITQ